MLKKRILIVDDEEGYRKVLANSLADMGFETKAVNSGLAALEEIQRQRYAIILLDVKMPGMDGIEFLDHMQEMRLNFYIVVITAYTDTDVVKEAIRKGAKKVITKPFSTNEIEACINEFTKSGQNNECLGKFTLKTEEVEYD
ncbi:MAG: response regulator [Candidatus Loosdrechtia sp.]|uniref:response regulator n=1 Tax=Candidatus Loosdrechtia sp. TaxID=3101272 RepID=UPI003A6B43AF|nr:MAG: response regulator [Candidatus Jettenia sp. AMX2]